MFERHLKDISDRSTGKVNIQTAKRTTPQFDLSDLRAFQTGYYSISPNETPLSQIDTRNYMHYLGKSKVTKLRAKAGVVYPLIRLPKTFADEIGNVAEIFETEQDNRRALVVTFNDGAGSSEVIQPDSKVIQLLPKVIQPDSQNNVESRLSALESQIAELRSLLLKNENQKAPQSPLFRQSTPKNQWARPDSNRRPPPCEGDVTNGLVRRRKCAHNAYLLGQHLFILAGKSAIWLTPARMHSDSHF
ncbi:MAG: hypothetical protein ACLPI9_00915 [Halobacteriota archaeon]